MPQKLHLPEKEELEFRLYAKLSLRCVMQLDDPGELETGGIKPIKIRFEYPKDSEDSSGEHLRVVAMTTRRGKGERLDAFRHALNSEDVPRDAPVRFLNPSPMIRLPKAQAELLRSVEKDLKKATYRACNGLRWKKNIFGSYKTVKRFGHIEFRLPNATWAHSNTQQPGQVIVNAYPSISPVSDVNALINDPDFEVPLSYELYMEAVELLMGNPRSSLAVLVAALESGLKSCINHLAPNTSWLLKNTPSPPVVNLLTEYLPTLLSNEDELAALQRVTSDEDVQILKSAIEQRNQLVHGSRRIVSFDLIEDCIPLWHDLVWTLEYLGGTDWALAQVGRNPRTSHVLRPRSTSPASKT